MSVSPLSSPLVRRLSKYLAGAVAVTGAAAEAKAEIIYTNLKAAPVTATRVGSTDQTILIDFVNQTATLASYTFAPPTPIPSPNQFRLATKGNTQPVYISGRTGTSGWIPVVGGGLNPKRMALNSTISTGQTFSTGNGGGGGLFAVGAWPTGTFNDSTGYVGVRFNIGAGTRHGWIHISQINVGGTPRSITIDGFAYNDLAGTILAGQTTPEPGAVMLSLLAFGSAGLFEYRRRRKTGATAEAEPIPQPAV